MCNKGRIGNQIPKAGNWAVADPNPKLGAKSLHLYSFTRFPTARYFTGSSLSLSLSSTPAFGTLPFVPRFPPFKRLFSLSLSTSQKPSLSSFNVSSLPPLSHFLFPNLLYSESKKLTKTLFPYSLFSPLSLSKKIPIFFLRFPLPCSCLG